MVFRNLNGSYSSVLELGTGQGTAKKIDASGDRSVRFTDKEGELVPLEAAQPEQENDVVTLQYLKDNALSLVGGSHYLEPMEVELSDAIKDDQSLVDGELIDDIGDPAGISTGSIRISKSPTELVIAKYVADVIKYSGVFKDNMIFQFGSGGISISAADFLSRVKLRYPFTAEILLIPSGRVVMLFASSSAIATGLFLSVFASLKQGRL